MALKFEAAKGDFTALAGLALFDEMTNRLNLSHYLKELLPTSMRIKHKKSYEKFKSLLFGFIAGADALDDMRPLSKDLGFQSVCKKTYTPSCYGDFLRSFELWQPRRLNEVLAKTALQARRSLYPNEHDFILDIDSSTHEQYAKKMEGLGYDYANKWGLDSLQAYDQFGFQYWMNVRAGGTHTSSEVSTVIERVFRQVPRRMGRYMRGDRGMCTNDVYNACLHNKVDFVIGLRSTMYGPLFPKIRTWRKAKNIRFPDGRPCEIASTVYFPKGVSRALRVVIIRAEVAQPGLFDKYEDRYNCFAWVTSLGEHEMGNEEVIEFYKKRGNAENYIRETKNAYDMHHFPCQKLLANKIYGIIAAFAHNLMRIGSFLISPKKTRFSKIIRFRMVFIAAQVVKKSRYVILRFSQHQYEEVNHWLTTIKLQIGTG